jgi:3-hydroxymyristoyl/3-hydroxydecanoyl-(acyl carrier protein) dehydratase
MNPHRLSFRIDANHPALAGHFPGRPIVPGVVLLDETLHAIEQTLPQALRSRPWQIGTVKFHHTAQAGEALQLQFHSLADGALQFELRCDETLIASGTALQRARIRAVAHHR